MKQSTRFISGFVFAAVISISLAVVSMAGEKGGSPIKKMSKDQLIKLAMSAAPAEISNDATIMIPGEDGKLVEAKKGTNGFTCIPDVDGLSKPDPICFDPPTGQWVNDLMSGAPKPTNAFPGVSYMAQGGWHFEKDGKILMKDEPGAKAVKEPPPCIVVLPL